MKKLMALLLALLMLCGALVSCKKDGDTAQTGDAAVSEVGDLEMLGLPTDVDMDGKEIILYNQPWQGYAPLNIVDLAPDDSEGTNIEVAARRRILLIEEKLNCKVSVEVGENKWGDGLAHLTNIFGSGTDQYAAVFIRAKQYISLLASGYLKEITEIPYLNLEKEWWDTDSLEALSISGHAGAICSDLTTNDDINQANIYFNKQMIQDNKLDSPYELVNSGKWTLEKMYTMAKVVASHPDAAGNMPENGPDDIYGFGYVQDGSVALLNSMGVSVCIKNANGETEYGLMASGVADRMQKLIDVLKDTNTSINFHARRKETATVEETQTFLDGRELFCVGGFYYAQDMRKSPTEFGIVPLPKYNDDQAAYITPTFGAALTIAAVPYVNTDLENTGIFMEYFAYLGNQLLRPALYDILLEGYLPRDVESLEMITLICDSVVYDTGVIFNYGGVIDKLFSNYNELKSTVASNVKLWERDVKNAIKDTVESFNK